MSMTGYGDPAPALLKMHSRPHLNRTSHCTRHIDRKHASSPHQTPIEHTAGPNTIRRRQDQDYATQDNYGVGNRRRSSWFLENSSDGPVLGRKLTGNAFKKVGKLIIETRRRPTGYGYGPAIPDINLEDFDQEYDFDAEDEPTPEEEEHKRQVKVLDDSYCKMCKMAGTVPCGKFRRQIGSATSDLSNCLLGEKDLKAICVALTNNVDITDLDLSGNDLSGKGCSYVAEALRENLNVHDLSLAYCNINMDGLKCIMDVLLEMKPMKYIDLSGNKFSTHHAVLIADVIQKNDYIEELVLSNNEFGEDSGIVLGKAIQHNVGLKRLDLSWNHLRREGATAVCMALRFNQSIEDLDLSWNGLCEEGCKALGYALPFNHTIKTLDISCNRINIFSLKDFLKGLEKNDSITTLRIDQNPLTTDGAILILKTLELSESTQIADVHMVDIPINGDFLEALDALQKVKKVRVYHRDPNRKKISPIVRKRTLKDFDPAMILFEYMKQENLRLIDLFRTFDTDSSQSVSKEELKDGFNTINMPLSDDALDSLFTKLDMNDNHEIEYEEIRKVHRKIINKMRIDEKSLDNFTAAIQTLKLLVKKALEDKRASYRENAKNNRPIMTLQEIMQLSRSEYKVGYRKAMRKMRKGVKSEDRNDAEAISQLKSLVKQALVDRRAEKLRSYRRPKRRQRQASLTAVFENAKGESLIHVLETHPDDIWH